MSFRHCTPLHTAHKLIFLASSIGLYVNGSILATRLIPGQCYSSEVSSCCCCSLLKWFWCSDFTALIYCRAQHIFLQDMLCNVQHATPPTMSLQVCTASSGSATKLSLPRSLLSGPGQCIRSLLLVLLHPRAAAQMWDAAVNMAWKPSLVRPPTPSGSVMLRGRPRFMMELTRSGTCARHTRA